MEYTRHLCNCVVTYASDMALGFTLSIIYSWTCTVAYMAAVCVGFAPRVAVVRYAAQPQTHLSC